jgi:probable F420-dependent oxidoreductase
MRIRFAVAPGAGTQAPEDLAELFTVLEALRFDTVWLSDLPVGPAPDPLLALAFAAARTTRLKLGANVVPLGRNPFRFAKELAQIDRASGGRLLLSFVPGLGTSTEREVLGFAHRDRGAYLETMIDLLRRWWAGEPVEHHEPGLDIPPVTLEGLPVQQPLEIWLGGRGPRALERVGRVADGWLGGLAAPRDAGSARRAIEAAAATAGRVIDADHFGIGVSYARAAPNPEVLRALQVRVPAGTDVAAVLPVGRDALRRLIDAHVAEGISKFVVRCVASDEPLEGELTWLADVLLPLQT